MEDKQKQPFKAAHALIVPCPAQGHINPFLQFAKRLLSHGVKITVANTKFITKSINISELSAAAIGTETISDGFDEGGYAQAESLEAYSYSFRLVGSQTLGNVIRKLDNSDSPVSHMILDGALPWALDVAKEFGLKRVIFFTQACAVNILYYNAQRGILPQPLPGPQVSLPGLPLLQVSDIPSFVADNESYPGFYDLVVQNFVDIDDADWILFNNFYKLESQEVNWMAKTRKVGTIGPTVPSMFLDKRLENDKAYGFSFFQPDTTTCLDWLQDKPNGSVVYVSFGSLAGLAEEQMEELAWGLQRSNFYFLWVVRASEQAKLPKNLVEQGKSLVVPWCPQLEVLRHKAIGCFVSHCGFNSVLEALSFGVPMVAMPQWTDQPTNAKYVEDVWKIGVRVKADEKGIVRKEMVEMCIKEVMQSEEIKENAQKWKSLAREAVDEGGTSDKNINEFVAWLTSSM